MKYFKAIVVAVASLLLISCGGGSGASDAPNVNVAPTASITEIASPVITGLLTFISGAASDANGDTLTYKWSLKQKPSGSSNAIGVIGSEMNLQFTPDTSGTYTISLVANDGAVNSQEMISTFTANGLPVIGDGNVSIKNKLLGQQIILDASASSDPDGNSLSYRWSFNSKPVGSSVQIPNATQSATGFTPDAVGTYEVMLQVSDSIATSSAVRTFNVSTTDRDGPTASAISLSSNRVDVSLSSQEITATVRVADATGFDTSQLALSYAKRYYSPDVTRISSWRLASGDGMDGVYEFKVIIPAGAQPGNWLFSVASSKDTLGNVSSEFYTDFLVK